MNLRLATLAIMAFFSSMNAHALRAVLEEPTGFAPEALDQINGTFEYVTSIQGGTTVQFWTEDLVQLAGCAPDTVLHVTNAVTGGGIASNDDCPGVSDGSSCLEVTMPGTGIVFVRVIVHAFATCTFSRGRFHMAGPGITDPDVLGHFGGHVFSTDDHGLEWGNGDRVEAIRLQNEPELRLYAWGRNPCGPSFDPTVNFLGRGTAGFGYNLRMDVPTPSSSHCGVWVVVGSTSPLLGPGKARLFVNDIVTDTDGDGLGNQLEEEVGLCSGAVGAPPCGCSQMDCSGQGDPLANPPIPPDIADVTDRPAPADVDRDGLLDGWEAIGYDDPNSNFDIVFPYLGADPTNKDVFVEVDWYVQPVPPPVNPPASTAPLSAQLAQAAVAAYASNGTAQIFNPGGASGVRLHLDIGVSSCVPGPCSTDWGDWGGASAVSTIQFEDSISLDMEPARQGLFRHGLIINPQATENGGRAQGLAFFINPPPAVYAPGNEGTLVHEIGHTLGLRHWGDPADYPLNCKVNYGSSMSYSYRGAVRFSTGSRPELMTTSLLETEGLGPDLPGEPTAAQLLTTYDYGTQLNPTTGILEVDWNRDGDFDVDPVIASTRWPVGNGGCDTPFIHSTTSDFDLNEDFVTALAVTTNPETILHHLYVDEAGSLRRRWFFPELTPCDANGLPAGCCPVDEVNSACGTWTESQLIATNTSLTSAPGVLSDDSGVLVAYSRGLGASRRIYIRPLGVASIGTEQELAGLTLLDDTTLSGGNYGATDVTIHQRDALVQLLFLGPGNEVRATVLDPATWTQVACSSGTVCDHPVYTFSSGALLPLLAMSPPRMNTEDADPGSFYWARSAFVGYVPNSIPQLLAVAGFDAPGVTNCVDNTDCATGSMGVPGWCNGTECRYDTFQDWSDTPAPVFAIGPVAYSKTPSSGEAEAWYVRTDLRIGRVWRTSDVGQLDHANRPYNLAHPVQFRGAAATVLAGELQVVHEWRNGTADMRHAPFAEGIFPIPERDNDDFHTMHRFMCARMFPETPEICGETPVDAEGNELTEHCE